MRKPAFCICENKDADQASSHLLWLYSLICVGLVGNPKDRFSHNEAHFVILLLIFFVLQYVLQFIKQLLKSMIEDVFI